MNQGRIWITEFSTFVSAIDENENPLQQETTSATEGK